MPRRGSRADTATSHNHAEPASGTTATTRDTTYKRIHEDVLFERAGVVSAALQRERAFETAVSSAETALKSADARALVAIYSTALAAETKLLADVDAAIETGSSSNSEQGTAAVFPSSSSSSSAVGGTSSSSSKHRTQERSYHHARPAAVRFDRRLELDDQVAAKVASHELWILARVVGFDTANDRVRVEDVDDDVRVHAVPRRDVLLLPRRPDELKLARTHFRPPVTVFAMYPDTTSFYAAQVVAAAHVSHDSPNTTNGRDDDDSSPTTTEVCLVRFADDENDHGLIPSRPIPLRFITHLPPHHLGLRADEEEDRHAAIAASSSAKNHRARATAAFAGVVPAL